MTITIRPVELEGEHFVTVNMDGCEMAQHGPFASAGEAEAMANQFAGACAVLHQPVTIGRRHGQRAVRRRA